MNVPMLLITGLAVYLLAASLCFAGGHQAAKEGDPQVGFILRLMAIAWPVLVVAVLFVDHVPNLRHRD